MSLRRRLTALLGLLLAAGSLAAVSVPGASADPPSFTGVWSPSPTSPIHLWQPSLVPLPDGRIFAVGQRLTPASPPYADMVDAGNAAYYDPATNSFQRVADPAHARVGQAVLLPDGRIAAFGGAFYASTGSGCPFGVGEVYNPATNTWTTIPSASGLDCSITAAAAVMPDGQVLVNADHNAIWNPATNTVTPLTGGLRWANNMVRLGSGIYATGQFPNGSEQLVGRFDTTRLAWDIAPQSVGMHATNFQTLVAVDSSTLLTVVDDETWLMDANTLQLTQVGDAPSAIFCDVAVPSPGVAIMVTCTPEGPSGAQTWVLDRSALAWEPTDTPLNPELVQAFARSVTVPSGTYFVGLNGTQDGFAFARLVEGASNHPPVAADLHRTVRWNDSYPIRLPGSDPDDDPLTYTLVDGPDSGTLSGTPPNLSYRPDDHFTGTDHVTYRVEDGRGGSDTGEVTITVADPLHGTWAPSPPLSMGLWEPSLVGLPDGRIFVIGQEMEGLSESNPAPIDAADAAFFDPVTMSFDRVADPAHAHAGEALLLPDGRIAAFGGTALGTGADLECMHGAGEVYDPSTDTWTSIPATPAMECWAPGSAALLPNGKVLVNQGWSAIWDPATNTTTALLGGPAGVADMIVVGGEVYGMGHLDGNQNVPFRFDPATQTFTYGDGQVGFAPDQMRQAVRVDASTVLFNVHDKSALLDLDTMHVTRFGGGVCAVGVPEPGTVIGVLCTGADDDPSDGESQIMELDPQVPRWRMTDLPYNPNLYQWFSRSITVASGTYFAGITSTLDRYHFDRFNLTTPFTNRAPSATDLSRSVRGGSSGTVVLGGSDPDGDALSFSVVDGPEHGDLTGTPPHLTYTPDAGYTDVDQFTFRVQDGAGASDVGTVSITVTDPVTGDAGVTQDVGAGQTVSTGEQPTASQPTQVSVTTPVAGEVSITELGSGSPPSGFLLVGREFRIEAPAASVSDPLRLTFTFDEDLLPAGETTADVVLFRDGAAVAPCADGSGHATPDPCVAERSSSGGVGHLVVLSSHASEWTLAVALKDTSISLAPVAPTPYGVPISLVATVAPTGGGAPTGTVTFRDTSTNPATVLGTAAVASDGTARLNGVLMAAGDHSVVARYGGSSTSQPSASAPRTVTITKAPIVVTAKPVSLLLSILQGKFTFSATAVSAVTGQPVVGAAVSMRAVLLNGQVFGCTATSDAHGTATCLKGGFGGLSATIYPQFYTAEFGATANHRAGSGVARMGL